MKIKHFKAEKVHGYLSYDIDFRKDLTFLIGLNGSGKTTVLKLISGLLTPNYLYLAKIKFSKIELTLYNDQNDDEICVIAATQNEDNFQLFIDEDKIGKFPILSSKSDDFEEYSVKRYIEKFDDSDYAKKIKKFIKPPIVLGLDRLGTDSTKIETDKIFESYYLWQKSNKIEKYVIDSALKKIEGKLREKAFENADKRAELSNNFREKVIEGLMKPKDESLIIKNFTKKMNSEKYFKELKKNIDSINPDYLKIPFLRDSYAQIVAKTENMVNKLAKLKPSGKNFNAYSYVIATYFFQLDNLDEIARIGEEYLPKIKEVDTIFTRLKDSLNLFFAETNKEVDITGKGDLEIKIKDTGVSNNIYELSSGEKQLVILFSQLAFAQDSKNSIFIVDEPELSLHLAWQEKFVEALQKACPEMQFILATHAPAIVNEKSRLGNCVNLSKQ